MQFDRYIRAYHKQTEALAFEVKLPDDCLTFLSMVDFLQDDIDPLLYGCYELDADQTDYIHRHFFVDNIADTDYFDYFLECDRVAESKVKTRQEVGAFFLEDYIKLLNKIFNEGVELKDFQDFGFKIYQQGVIDGRV